MSYSLTYQQPNILFFRGIFPKSYDIETLFEKQILEKLQSTAQPQLEPPLEEYQPLPNVFINMATWPTSTNLCCWNCNRVPPRRPLFIPLDYVNGTFPRHGVACSFVCSAALIDALTTNEHSNWSRHKYLKILYKIITGHSIAYITRSPPRTITKKYGGATSAIDYYASIDSKEAALSEMHIS